MGILIYIYTQKYYFENSLIEVKMIAIMKRGVHLWGFKKAWRFGSLLHESC